MDVYRPGRAVQGAPIILMVHGGGWIRGDKTHRRTLVNKANYFTRHGMIFISTNYRLVPDATPLEQTDDIAMALAFVQKNAQSWGGHADKVILMGHSAGAHLVSLINSDPSIAAAQGARPWRAVVSLDSAAYDLPKTYNNNLGLRWIYRRAFGDDEKTLRLSSPSHRLRPGGAPLLAVCSQLRADRPCDDASDFVQKLIKIGGRGAVLPISMTHGDINDMLGVTNPYTAQVMDFISTYIDP
jgi:acetyl esterase/lipase